MKEEFAFCESVYATAISPWHIRVLTKAGKKLGGSADTLSLCGRNMGWDLEPEINEDRLSFACKTCLKVFRQRTKEKDNEKSST